MERNWLIWGALFGGLAVALGAFGAHALKPTLDAYDREIYEKAVHYQMFHAVALLFIGCVSKLFPGIGIQPAGWGFLCGILFFSGSLYLLALFGLRWLGALTPLGGLAFLFAWGWLIVRLVMYSGAK